MTTRLNSLLNALLVGALTLTSVAGTASLTPVLATAAPVRYAKPGGATMGICDSWATACELRYALGTVAVAGDEIWVARGVYTPGVALTATFVLTDGVALYGGFAMTEILRDQRNWAANITVLSGDIEGNDLTDTNKVVTDTANIRGNNVYHVVIGRGVTNTAGIDGFIVTGGNANNMASSNYAGGGMYNYNGSSPTLTNVTFSGNFAYLTGGGMYNENGNPTLTNITFSGNSTHHSGGGMFNSYASPTLTNVTFSGNSVDSDGGGMYNSDSSSTLTNVTFSSNSATTGGGMFNSAGSSSILTNVTFNGNSANNGGGLYNNSGSSTLTNVTFNGNSATYAGGMFNGGSSTLTNVTFNGNSATDAGGMYNDTGSWTIVRNTLFAQGANGSNCNGEVFTVGSTNNLANDASCGISVTQSANIKLGVLGNYGGSTQTVPLLPGSAAIDTGNDTYCPATDQRGFRRAGQCDIGAYEAPRWSFVPLVLKNYEFFFEGPAEAEDNDVYTSANGPLRSGKPYQGYPNDEKDYFSVHLPTPGNLAIDLTGHTGNPVQVQVFYQTVSSPVVCSKTTPPYTLACPASQAGWYYLYIYSGGNYNSTTPYTLQVTYP